MMWGRDYNLESNRVVFPLKSMSFVDGLVLQYHHGSFLC